MLFDVYLFGCFTFTNKGRHCCVSDCALGEHEIIKLITGRLAVMPNMPVGFGDDESVVPLGSNMLAVLKTDMLVGRTDIPRGMSLWQAARKAIVMNVSDFASKGVQPSAALVSLALPRELAKKESVLELAEGLNAGAQEYGCYVVGGDTNEAADLILSISLFGLAKKDSLMLRNGACVGDILAVTGTFGKTAAGLKVLLDNYATSDIMQNMFVDSVFNPKARLKEGLALANCHKCVSASMDSSDGLAWSLHELSKQNDMGFTITNLPVSDEIKDFASQNGLDSANLALYGGEEYELVLTIKPSMWNKAKAAVDTVGGNLIPIGKATEQKDIILCLKDQKRTITPRGYEHFT